MTDPSTEHRDAWFDEYEHRLWLVERAKERAFDPEDRLNHRLLNLCDRYVFGEISVEEFSMRVCRRTPH